MKTKRTLSEWIAKSLSPEQQRPFERTHTNACILAAAGSGKTRTLVRLLVDDVANGVPPENIVCFTFTEKAAEELLARIHALAAEQLPGTKLSGISIGTIHAWCLRHLTGQSRFYNFTPLDELQVDALVSRLYDVLHLEAAYGQKYPKAVDAFILDMEVFFNEHLPLNRVPAKIKPSIDAFLSILDNNRMITFGGMIRAATEHLRANGPLRAPCRIYVDEYQDVNPAQVELLKAMLPADGRLVVVGDDLQCIYNWRGSDVTRIINFHDEFSDVGVYRLRDNYRSRPGIVELGNAVSESIVLRDPEKVMKAIRPESKVPSVHWLSASSIAAQDQMTVDVVMRLLNNGVPPHKIAVLLRSVVGSGRSIVEAMQNSGIAVQCPGLNRGSDFIDEVVIPLLDWLRRDHPEPKNEMEERDAEFAANQMWVSVGPWVSPDCAEVDFWKQLSIWLDLIDAGHNSAYDVRGRLYDLFDACGVRISPGDDDLTVGLGIASQVIRSVEEIHRRRLAGQSRRTARGLMSETFYTLIRQRKMFGESVPIDTSRNAVVVSTVHQAKGLEWPVVILPNLLSMRFPLASKPHGTSFPDQIAARYGTTIDDERRLFFVAATRARERLFLIDGAGISGKRRSEFLRDLEKRGAISRKSVDSLPPNVWKVDAADLKNSASPPLRIGLSDLLIYAECPFQYALKKIANIQPSVGEELGYGKSLHELIQRRLDSGERWSEAELEAQADAQVFMPLASARVEADSKRAIAKRISRLEALRAFGSETQSEISVEIPVGAGIVHGIIDCVHCAPQGGRVIRDWKSNIHEEYLPRYVKQLHFYIFALLQSGGAVTGAELVDVAASDREGRLVAHAVDIDPNSLHNTMVELAKCVEGINKRSFGATPSSTVCGACDLRRVCKMAVECE